MATLWRSPNCHRRLGRGWRPRGGANERCDLRSRLSGAPQSGHVPREDPRPGAGGAVREDRAFPGGIRAAPRGQGPRLVTSVAPPEAPQQLLPGAREDAQERRRRGIRTSGWHCEARGFPSVWQPRHRRAVHRRHSRRRSARTGRPGSLPGGGGPCRRIVPGRAPLGASRGTCDDEPSRNGRFCWRAAPHQSDAPARSWGRDFAAGRRLARAGACGP
mmetsp:Transcript_13699/g.52179  ORF Transcript_13699/g.52179 Transcript_13699/m.52179 type:complete len:217 (+) Transcript_13699:2-652(+)